MIRENAKCEICEVPKESTSETGEYVMSGAAVLRMDLTK